MSEPTYSVTVTIRRSDEPGASFKARFSDIPRESAEAPDYFLSASVSSFRRLCLGELKDEAPPAEPQA
jgi:hypothetical protein